MADYVVQTTVRLDDQVSAGAQAAATALNKLGDAAAKAVPAIDGVVKTTERAGPSFDTVNRRIDENAKLTIRLDGINRAYTQGMAAVRAEADAGGLSTAALAEKEARLATLRDQQTTAARKQAAAMAESFGVQNNALNQNAAASGNAAFAQRQFGVQSVQLFSSIATGQPVLTALIQQGHQMVDVALSTGTGFGVMGNAIKSALGAILSPIGLAVTAIAGIGIATAVVISHTLELAERERALGLSIEGTGRSAAITVSQLEGYQKQLVATGTSAAEAQKIVDNLARTQGLSGPTAQKIVSEVPKLASVTGVSDIEAQTQLTQANLLNKDAVVALATALGTYTSQQDLAVTSAKSHKDTVSALTTVLAGIDDRLGLVRSRMSGTDEATKSISKSWGDFLDTLSRTDLVKGAMEGIANALDRISKALKASTLADWTAELDKLKAEAAAMPDSAKIVTRQTDFTRQAFVGSNPAGAGGAGYTANIARQKELTDMIDKFNADQAKLKADQDALAQSQKAAADKVVQDNTRKQSSALAQNLLDSQPGGQIPVLEGKKSTLRESIAELQQHADLTEADKKQIALWESGIKAADAEIAKINKSLEVHITAMQKAEDTYKVQLASEIELTEATKLGQEAVNKVTATREAETKALGAGRIGTKAYNDEVARLLPIITQLQGQKGRTAYESELKQANDQADAQQRINAAYDGTTQSVTHATNVERVRASLIKDGITNQDEFNRKLDAEVAALDRGAKASADFQQAQQSVAALANVASNAMDQLGQGIVDAFTSGSGSAVNFGNIMKSVITSVLSQLAKLAVINPIINSVLGTALPTLGSAVNAIGNSGGGGGGGGGGDGSSSTGNLASYASTGISAYGALSRAGSGGGGLFSGMGNLFSSSAMLSSTTTGTGWFAGAMNTPLISGSSFVGPTLSAEAASGMGLSADAAAMAAPQGAAGVTVGGALSSIGTVLAAYEVGSTIGGYLAGDSPQRQTTSKIGSGIGAVAGFAIGGPGGAFIGATVLGALGGLIGPGKKNMYSSQAISVNDKGQFEIGRMLSQVDPNAAAEEAAALSDTATINKYMTANNIRATSTGQIWQLGDNTPGGFMDPSKAANFSAGFSNYRFTAANDNANPEMNTALAKVLDGTSFATPADLEKAVTGVQDFLNKTVPGLLAIGKTTGSLNDNIKTTNDTFGVAITQAQKLGVEEENLTKARDEAVKSLKEEAAKNLAVTNRQLDLQYNSALASFTGNTQLAHQTALDNFDDNAKVQRDALMNNLVKTYGDVYKTTTEYADLMAKLEKALGEQRLDLIKSFDQQAVASVTGTITNLANYATSLKGSTASPLNTVDQYYSAVDKFNAVSGAAKAGDYNSIVNLPGYANALLGLSREMYGSGTGYVADFNKVIDVLDSLSTLTADTLTASFYAAQTAAQTDTIVKALTLLKTEVTGVKLAITQSTSAPARVAQNG